MVRAMRKRRFIIFAVSALWVLLAACSAENAKNPGSAAVGETGRPAETQQLEAAPIPFPEAPEEFTKAKSFYGYYILQDSDVIFAMNEEESRFCVKFTTFARREIVLYGSVEDGICTVDPGQNGLFGEDIQLMYEDAMEERTPWAAIIRD